MNLDLSESELAFQQEARAWLNMRYENEFDAPFYDDARWTLPAPSELVKATTNGFVDPSNASVSA